MEQDQRLHSAAEHLREGDLDAAEELVRAALAVDGADARANHLMALCLGKRGRHREASAHFERSLAADPVQPAVLLDYGNAMMAMGAFDAAALTYQRAANLSARNVPALYNQALALLRLGKVEDAIDALDDAIEVDPSDWQLRYTLGNALYALGDSPGALEELEHAARLAPEVAGVHNNLGRVLLDLGRPEDAVAPLRRAAADGSVDYGARAALAQALVRTGRSAEAVDLLGPSGGSAEEQAWRLAALHELGRHEERAELFDARRDVRVLELPLVGRHADLEGFLDTIAEALRSHPGLDYERPGSGTVKGSQTPPISEHSGPLADFAIALRQLLGEELEGMSLFTWGTFLDSGGHQEPHIHEAAGPSGVVYLRVPLGLEGAEQNGWLEIDGDPPGLQQQRAGHRVEPRPGRVVIFPSGVFHRPLAFQGSERISLNFVLVPR